MRLENTRFRFSRMQKLQTVILLLLGFRSVSGISVSNINCGNICSAVPGSPYTLTCIWSGSLTTGIIWLRDNNLIANCNQSGSCFPVGYSTGNYPNATAAVLTITAFDNTTDTGLWECRDGSDPTVSCSVPVVATGRLQGTCTRSGNSFTISCSGITSPGSPPVTLKIMDGSNELGSATSGSSVSSTQTDAAGKTYTCEVTGTAATCLSPTSVTCEADCLCQCSCACERNSTIVLIIAVILLAVCIAFIITFCVCNIKKYYDQYRLAVFIWAIVVCSWAIACTIVVFVSASTVETPQADGKECCCSTCEPDDMEMRNKCVGLKICAAFFSILVDVLMLIIIIIILIVRCCPGKCGTEKLLMCCNIPPAEAGPTTRSNSNGGSAGTSSHSGRHQSGNETTGKSTDVRMLQTSTTNDSPSGTLTPIDFSKLSPGRLPPLNTSPDYAIDEEDTSNEHEENGTGALTDKKKSKKRRKKKIRSQRGGETE